MAQTAPTTLTDLDGYRLEIELLDTDDAEFERMGSFVIRDLDGDGMAFDISEDDRLAIIHALSAKKPVA